MRTGSREIPEFTRSGVLPPGIHSASWSEFAERFGYNEKRRWLLEGLDCLLLELTRVGCRSVYIDGSFVTNKECPGDYDLCWKMTGVIVEMLDPLLQDYSEQGKRRIEAKYRGDVRGAEFGVLETGATYLEFFQYDRDGKPKGVVELNPKRSQS